MRADDLAALRAVATVAQMAVKVVDPWAALLAVLTVEEWGCFAVVR